MILDEITIKNFGVFNGKQTAILTPPSKKKPITIIGGLNGNGKTTIIEAVQLALYGKLSTSFRNNHLSYENYLRKLINRYAEPSEGATIEISFRSIVAGKTKSYRVCRSWSIQNNRLTEKLNVFIDDKFDPVSTETWVEQVEYFIPARLSHLFFFDGERIEALADPQKSARLLKTAVDSLLGIDLVDQLKLDLLVLDRRKKKKNKDSADHKKIEDLERELSDFTKRISLLKQNRANLQNQQDRAEKQLKEIEARFIEEGGELLENSHSMEQTQSEIQGKLQVIEERLINISAGTLPLLLVKNMLVSIVTQARKEKEANRAKILIEAINDRDSRLVEKIKKTEIPISVLEQISEFLEKDRQKHLKATKIECYLDLPEMGFGKTEALLHGLLEHEKENATHVLDQFDSFESDLHDIDRKLAAVPDKDALAGLVEKRQQSREKFNDCEKELYKIDHQLEELEKQKSTLSAKLETLLRTNRQAKLDDMDVERFLKHSERVKNTLEKFRVSLIRKHARQLENLILEGYQSLLRKKSLVSGIKIDPDTCALELQNGCGPWLSTECLSAGERQLLATSMLWGLSRASGRPLPVVIDTPLGRLDSSHRNNLVERYFPFASHQVLLLSTDKEIDKEYFNKLAPWIGNAYQLKYDDASRSSSIIPGYFWQGAECQ